MKYIPYGRQSVTDEDIRAVIEILKSDWLTQGPTVERFEKAVADYCGARYAVAVANGTAALHSACFSAGLQKGDLAWTSPNSFVASANAALYLGAEVDFVDISSDTGSMSAEHLEEKLINARKKNKLPKVVIPVDFAGHPCEIEKIKELSSEYGFTIIEDACHAIGADYSDGKVGNSKHSDMTIFSFHPVKIITTGEGGMVLTNSRELYESLLRFRTHGITREKKLLEKKNEGAWYYEQHQLGLNYRITDFQCALGMSQLEKIEGFIARRIELAGRYEELLSNLPVKSVSPLSGTQSAWHLYVICLEIEKIGKSRKDVFEMLRTAGIGVNVHYIPIHTQPFYKKLGFKVGDFPESEKYYETAITLPLFPTMTNEEQDYVIGSLKNACS